MAERKRQDFVEDIKKISANADRDSIVQIHFVHTALSGDRSLCLITYPREDKFIATISLYNFEDGELPAVSSLLTYPAGLDAMVMLVISK